MLFGLALLVQVWAPAAAAMMLGQGADPFGLAIHCATDDVGGADHSTPNGGSPCHDHCPLCQIVCGGPALFEARPISVAVFRAEAGRHFWTIAPEGAALFGEDQHRPPRGPPFLT